MSDYVETLQELGVMKADGNMSGACYRCKHRGTIAGNAHSRCGHPVVGGDASDPVSALFALVDPAKASGMIKAAIALKIVGDPHGVASGWFLWPFDFDPVWLRLCAGFEQSEGDKKETAIAS